MTKKGDRFYWQPHKDWTAWKKMIYKAGLSRKDGIKNKGLLGCVEKDEMLGKNKREEGVYVFIHD